MQPLLVAVNNMTEFQGMTRSKRPVSIIWILCNSEAFLETFDHDYYVQNINNEFCIACSKWVPLGRCYSSEQVLAAVAHAGLNGFIVKAMKEGADIDRTVSAGQTDPSMKRLEWAIAPLLAYWSHQEPTSRTGTMSKRRRF